MFLKVTIKCICTYKTNLTVQTVVQLKFKSQCSNSNKVIVMWNNYWSIKILPIINTQKYFTNDLNTNWRQRISHNGTCFIYEPNHLLATILLCMPWAFQAIHNKHWGLLPPILRYYKPSNLCIYRGINDLTKDPHAQDSLGVTELEKHRNRYEIALRGLNQLLCLERLMSEAVMRAPSRKAFTFDAGMNKSTESEAFYTVFRRCMVADRCHVHTALYPILFGKGCLY